MALGGYLYVGGGRYVADTAAFVQETGRPFATTAGQRGGAAP